jgi:hypothetical protein
LLLAFQSCKKVKGRSKSSLWKKNLHMINGALKFSVLDILQKFPIHCI